MTRSWDHYVDGAFMPPSGGKYLDEFVPATGKKGEKIAAGSAEDVDKAVLSAQAAQAEWQARKPLERGRILTEVARVIRANIDDLAEQESKETGKPLWMARFETETTAQYFEFYGGLAVSLHGETIDIGPQYHAFSTREPFGVVGVILPWNAPMNQAARGVAPALAVGNTAVAKPSEFTSVSLLRLADLMVREAGVPKGVFNVVLGDGAVVGEALVSHDLVRKVAFTGSVRAGRAIGRVAADRIIPLTLELGGKSPNIVFDDADFAKAVPGSVHAFTINSGQVCIAGTRCLVQRSILSEFTEKLVAEAAKMPFSDGTGPGLGPITTLAQYERIQNHFATAKAEGARVLVGGKIPDDATEGGWFVGPTIYTDVTPEMTIVREEVFGPVAVIIPFDDEADAIRIANDTVYGLGAGIWTCDVHRALRVAGKIQAGQVYVNEYPSGGVETPFGGYKQSGYGREKGVEALHHYTQTKTVIMKIEQA